LKWSTTPDCVLTSITENVNMVDDNVGRIGVDYHSGKLSRAPRSVLQAKRVVECCLKYKWNDGLRG
jgi:hypothetical protein